MAEQVAGLAAIRAAFSEPVDYYHSVGDDPIPNLPVIWSDEAGTEFQGSGNTTRTITAEIAFDATGSDDRAIPGRPDRETRIGRKSVFWTVAQVLDRDDIGAWVVTLEGEEL
jgi:hypothetical protein